MSRFYFRKLNVRSRSFHAVLRQRNQQFVGRQIGEHKVVYHGKGFAVKEEINRLINLFHFKKRRIRASVRADYAVEGKVAVVRLVAPVAAVGPFGYAVANAFYALIGKVPYIAAVQSVVALEVIHIVAEIAERVTHAVGVFAQNKRPVFVIGRFHNGTHHVVPERAAMDDLLVLADFFHLGLKRVHFAVQIGGFEAGVRLVVDRTGIVYTQNRLTHNVERSARARFVAQTPEHYGRMIFVALNHVGYAIHARSNPHRVGRRNVFGKAVSFEVVFAHNQNAVTVAEVVETSGVRIMAGSDAVYVVLFAQNDVFFRERKRHCVAVVRMKFVAVDALYHIRPAV